MNVRLSVGMMVSLLLAGSGALGADLYVSSEKGDDGNSGSADMPFKTIQKAASVANAGDTVNIHAGTYRETVTPARSGTSAKPITFKPCDGERVTISGAAPITGWTLFKGNIHVADMKGDFFSTAQPGTGEQAMLYDAKVHNQADQVFYKGQMMFVARWPNTPSLDVSQPVKADMDTFVSKTRGADKWSTGVMTDGAIANFDPSLFIGAEIMLHAGPVSAWSNAISGFVTAKNGSELTFKTRTQVGDRGDNSPAEKYNDNSRYYVFNKLELLDSAGEWYHDKPAGKLYLWAPGGANPQGSVEAKKRELGFNLTDKSYITIQGISLVACTITTDLYGDNIGHDATGNDRYPWRNWSDNGDAPSVGVVLDGLEVKYPTHFTDVSGHWYCQWGLSSGITLSGADHVLKNSIIQYSAGVGVGVMGRRSRITHNTILDTNYHCHDLGAIFTGGVDRGSSDHEIGYNTITRTGKHGIMASNFYRTDITDGSDWKGRIHHNDISDFAIQCPDTGGIYSGGDSQFVRWDHNWIHDAHANIDNVPDAGNFSVSGVYPDYGRNVIMDHNVIWNVEWGIHTQSQVGKSSNYLIYNNTVRLKRFADNPYPGNRQGPRGIYKNSSDAELGSVLRNNIISCSPNTATDYQATDYPKTANDPVYRDNLEWDNVAGSTTDPTFVNLNGTTGLDYQIQSGSAAENTGVVMPAHTRDGIKVPAFNDKPSGVPDKGAYERGVAPWRAGPEPRPKASSGESTTSWVCSR